MAQLRHLHYIFPVINLSRLNTQQQKAARHYQGPLLILAGAGSGKTMTMAHRMAWLMAEKKVPGHRILGLSFTNKSARELRDRSIKLAQKHVDAKQCQGLLVSTFHSLCVRILREFAEHIGYRNDFTILDQSDQVDLVRGILRNIRIDDRKFDPQMILSNFGRAKNLMLSTEEAEQSFLQHEDDYAIATASAYKRYQDKLKNLNAMDFDDLLSNAVQLLQSNPEVCQRLSQRYQFVMVDEYQDTNGAQFRLLQNLTQNHQNLVVVGDDDQSIYAWRGADPSHILNFKKYYPQATVITLDQNYRCTENILSAANKVIAQNRNRHPKSLWSERGCGSLLKEVILEDDREENEWVARELNRLKSLDVQRPWHDYAILFRGNAQSRGFEEALRQEQIPYRLVGGMSYLDRKEIKDLLCYWRLTVNLNDDASLRRIINWPARGIGSKTQALLNQMATVRGISLFETLSVLQNHNELNPKARLALAQFKNLILDLKNSLQGCAGSASALSLWARESLKKIGIRQALLEECEKENPAQAELKWASVEEICNGISYLRQENPSALGLMRDYLSNLALNKEENEDEKSAEEKAKNKVTLMTLHSAKGLEFPVVFLVGMEDGILPHRKTIEDGQSYDEERRLCYVGITRAKDELYLCRAKHRIKWGKPIPSNPSRFLESIPRDLLDSTDLSKDPDLKSKEQVKKHEERVTGFLAQIRSRINSESRP